MKNHLILVSGLLIHLERVDIFASSPNQLTIHQLIEWWHQNIQVHDYMKQKSGAAYEVRRMVFRVLAEFSADIYQSAVDNSDRHIPAPEFDQQALEVLL